mgnify:CR=1 FL=1
MKENKLITMVVIVTIVSILLVFCGITYAYFTASNNQGSTAVATIDTGKMLITYNDGTDNIEPVTNIQPSDKILVNKTFSLTGTNTATGMATADGLEMPYKVGVQYTSTFSDGMMHYYIKEMERPANSKVTTNYVITPETGKTEDDYKNQTIPGNDTYTGYTHGTFKNGSKYTEMVTGEFPASLNDQTITFNLIIQFPDNGINQDSEKGKTFNGKVVVNYEPPKPKSFAEDTWETIAATVKENPKSYAVGSTKKVEIGGQSYTVRVANNTTPEECTTRKDFSQTACGFVVEFADIVETRKMNPSSTNLGGWPKTAMRTYANNDFYNKLPEELRNVIKSTKVVSGHGNYDKNNEREDGNWESEDKIYLLSAHEVYEDGTSDQILKYDSATNNTRQLDYYKNLGVTTNNYSNTIKKNNGSNTSWWLRAAYSNISVAFLLVFDTGDWGSSFAGNSNGFAPAFRIG